MPGSHELRSRELSEALRTGFAGNGGNHSVVVTGAMRLPSWDKGTCCEGCDRRLVCLQQGEPPSVDTAQHERRGCHYPEGLIIFRYHGTDCLGYDHANKRITDYGLRGRSVTTGRAITWYLWAIADHCYITHKRADELAKKWSKRGHDPCDRRDPNSTVWEDAR